MKKITQLLVVIAIICCSWQNSAQGIENGLYYPSPLQAQRVIPTNPIAGPTGIIPITPTQGNEFCAVTHSPYITEMEQPNGQIFRGRILTVDKITYLETVDGYTIMQDPADKYFKYAAQGVDGELYLSNVKVSAANRRTAQETRTLNSLNEHARFAGAPLRERLVTASASRIPSGVSVQSVFPNSGVRKSLLLLIDYPDQLATYSNAEFNNLSNQVGYNVNGQTGSFRDFYLAASYGTLTINTDVSGWYTATNNRATYGVDDINARNFFNAVPLIREAVDAAETAGVNYADYDGDGDGAVDVVMVIHSGRGSEESGNAADIWSHRWVLAAAGLQVTYDGKLINDYIIQAEKYGPVSITNIGVMCHEFGHALGLPDLYDADGGSQGLGNWCLMAGGTWNNNGKTPAHPSVYCKDEMGWMTPTLLTGSGAITNMDYSQSSGEAYRLNTLVGTEYFLIENRQNFIWDAFLPGSGLCIYHIDRATGDNTNPARYRVNLEQGDGLNNLNNNVNRGDAGDTFPGSSNNTILNCVSNPNSKTYNGNESDANIYGIVAQAANKMGFNYFTAADYTALPDISVSAGVQTGLGSGTPIGGVYSGPGVTDDGNGTTYSFDPAAAGVGVHTLNYEFSFAGNCADTASDNVEVLPAGVTFTAPADMCIDAGVQAGLGGGAPTGGTYSGPGVTDDGNGTTYSFDPALAGVGTHILTYTQGGSSATDNIDVFALPTVTFTIGTSPVCPGTVLTGEGGGTPTGGAYSGPGVTDDGNGSTYTFDSSASGNGIHTITYDYTDGNGCSGSATDTVTVEDTTPPVITCPGNITQNNDPGVCNAVVNYVVTATDNCGASGNNQIPNQNSTFSGNARGYWFTAPIDFVITGLRVPNTASADGQNVQVMRFATTPASWPSNSSYDALLHWSGLTPGNNFIPVNIPVTAGEIIAILGTRGTANINSYTSGNNIDIDGNIVNIERFGTQNPIDAAPGPQGTYWTEIGGSSKSRIEFIYDSSPTPTQTAGLPSGSTFPIGTTTNTFVATDSAGNTSSCSFTITIEDNELPVANCAPAFTLQLDAAGNASIAVGDIENGSTDNCGIATTTINKSNFTCADVGSNTVTLTVTDVNGNLSTCTTVVTVEDNVAPTAVCQPFTAQLDATGNVTITGADVDNGSTDACGIASLTVSPNTFTCADVGPNTVTLTVTDVNGNSSTCTTTVTVEDTVPPTITCPGDITVNNDLGVCGAVVNYTVTATDNCGSGGSSSQTFTYTGAMENFTVPAGITSIDVTSIGAGGADGNYGSTAGEGGRIDATIPVTPGEILNIYVGGSGLPASSGGTGGFNGGGNGASGSATIYSGGGGGGASDIRIAPYGLADRIIVAAGGGGGGADGCTAAGLLAGNGGGLTGTGGDAGAMCSCNPSGLGGSQVAGGIVGAWACGANCNATPGSFGVGGNGNTSSSCGGTTGGGGGGAGYYGGGGGGLGAGGGGSNFFIPAATAVSNVTGGQTGNGLVTITWSSTATTVTQTAGLPSGNTFPVGTTTNTFVVTDASGNTATCSFDVTVNDTEPPVANCAPAFTLQLDAAGNASITVGDIENGSTDTCGVASTTIDKSTFTCADVGLNTITLTVTDVNGNVSTCTTIVTVEDSIPPTIICPADITANTDPGDCFATVTFVTPVAFDNCGIATIIQTMGDPSGSGFPVGVNTIEFTAIDVNGNTSTCSFNITVTDNEAPVAVCQNITIQLDAAGYATIVAADVDGGSTDQCGVASTTIDINTFDCSDVGDNNVILTVTDVNGNTSTCTSIVTVEDVTAPVVVCQDITVVLDASGTVTITGIDVDGGSTDACGIASYDLDMDTFDCSNVGANTVILTVTDVNGNAATCTATVTVEDNTSPVLVCQDFTLELGADGTATLDPSDVIASNDDACGIFASAVDITAFDCSDIGTPITVQVFTIDVNGNLATCTAEVTVVDLLAPVITCPADQTVDPGPGNIFYILPDYFGTGEATAIDNCTDPVTVTTQTPAAGTPLSDGTYTITLTATDEYGNTSTCDFELIVETELGVGDNNQDLGSIKMYPVPAKNILNISNPQSLELERLEIYDLRGRLVQSADLRGMGNVKTLNIDQLAAAAYYVKIKGANGEITKRLLKE